VSIDRRTFMKSMGIATAALVFPQLAAPQATRPSKPNIVVVFIDDQDKSEIGAFGGNACTPNLDRLAREGVIFDNAFVSHTVCTPSRYALFTGRHAGRSTSATYQNACPPGSQGYVSFNMALEDDGMNVASVLSRAGYATGFVGKTHVLPEGEHPKATTAPGQTVDEAFKAKAEEAGQFMLSRGFQWARHVYPGNMEAPFNHHNPEWTVQAAFEFIEQNRDRPFYLHYCTTLLHGPDRSWRESMDHPLISGEGTLEKPIEDVMTDREALLEELRDKGFDPEAGGNAGCAWLDDSVGAIMRKLDELGIADNTLFVYLPDHGSTLKSSLFHKDGVNVPLIMRWPRVIQSGARSAELVQHIDFVPTFFEIAGADVPAAYVTDGRSLLPLLKGQTPADWRDHLYFEIGCARAVATKEWKYIAVRYSADQIEAIKNSPPERLPKLMAYIGRTGIGTRGAVKPGFFDEDQLYNLNEDPEEMNNLARDPALKDRLEAMKAMLKADLETFNRPFGEFVPGGNAAPPGQIDEQIRLVKSMKIQGKTIVLPDGTQFEDASSTEESPGEEPVSREDRRAQRQAARQKAREVQD